MVLDEPKDTDEIFRINGLTMIMDKDLLVATRDVTVDYMTYGMGAGFSVTSQVPIGGGGSCGSASCSC